MVLLERAMLSYALDYLIELGLMPISVPALVREEPLIGNGQFPAHREETYAIPADDLYLAGTAEVALVGLHAGEILDAKALPIRYAGISPCFRREAGSAGRDVRGLLRVHQFEKVEQFVICGPMTRNPTAGTPSCSTPPSTCSRVSAWRTRWWRSPPAIWARASTG